jgi:hypothetical protein
VNIKKYFKWLSKKNFNLLFRIIDKLFPLVIMVFMVRDVYVENYRSFIINSVLLIVWLLLDIRDNQKKKDGLNISGNSGVTISIGKFEKDGK